eukprot:PITA_14437
MTEEYQSILKNDVWEIMPRPEGKSIVSSKWIYKIKHVVDGSVEKYKARFVACGFSQKEGANYEDTFALVAKYASIRIVTALASTAGWKLHQMDVKTVSLNGIIEEVYIGKPQGFEVYDKETHVCKLKQALYGLKQAPRAWYSCIDDDLLSIDFKRSDVDLNLNFKVVEGEPLILLLPRHVHHFHSSKIWRDGLQVKTAFLNGVIEEEVYIGQPQGFEVYDKETHVCKLKKALYGLKQAPRAWYACIDDDMLSLGFKKSDVDPNLNFKVIEGHGKYIVSILQRFGMMDCKSMDTLMVTNWKKIWDSDSALIDPTMYRKLIGSLNYLVNTKLDICYAINALIQFFVEPHRVHWVATKHIMRYLQRTSEYGLIYASNGEWQLYGSLMLNRLVALMIERAPLDIVLA